MTDNLNSLKRPIAGCVRHELANWSSLSNLQNIQGRFSTVVPIFSPKMRRKKTYLANQELFTSVFFKTYILLSDTHS